MKLTLTENQRQTKRLHNSTECVELKLQAVSLDSPAHLFYFVRQPLFLHPYITMKLHKKGKENQKVRSFCLDLETLRYFVKFYS